MSAKIGGNNTIFVELTPDQIQRISSITGRVELARDAAERILEALRSDLEQDEQDVDIK